VRRSILVLVIVLLSLGMTGASAAPSGSLLDQFLSGVQKKTLPNGLTLLTRESPGSGVVAINTWVKAGYFNEPDEVAGMAHLFEHMFFKGSKKFPGAEQIAEELSSVGGRTNAGTIYDSTNYYFVVPKEGFRRAVEIQADAVINPLFNPEELKKEAEVVIEESNRKLDNPPAVSMERMFATQFTEHRMKRWRIGSNDVLRNINRDDLIAFFETLYRPENMILSIAGDVTHEEAHQIALETFGKLPKGKLDKKRGPEEPGQKEFRYGSSTADLKQGYSVMGWHTPGVGNEDEIALDVLSSILGSGRSSRLYVNVVGPDGASTSRAFHFTFDDIGVFGVQSSFDEAKREVVDRKVLAEVERMKAHGPSTYELQLAKNAVESGIAFQLEDVLGQAQTLSQYEANYGYEALSTRLAKLNGLKTGDIQRVAKKYLTTENLTLYHYAPNGTPETTRDAALAMVRDASAKAPEAVADVAMPAESKVVRRATGNKAPKSIELANGMTLVVEERAGAPVISSAIYFPGGRTAENNRNAGITQLMTRSLRKGTKSRSGEQIDREIEFLGTQLDVDVNADYFGISLDILGRNYRAGMELLADVVLNPTFPDKGVEEEKYQQLASIKRSYDSSTQRPFQLAFEALWSGHPYALPTNGYETSLAGLDAGTIRDWWTQHVVADGALVVVAGDVSADEARAIVESAFAKLPRREGERPAVAKPAAPPARLEVVEYRDRKQSAIVYAFPTVPRSHDDWPKLRLMSNITSGLAGTFFAELRGRRSLAYTVFAGEFTNAEGGSFISYLASDASKEAEAREALLGEIRRLRTDGFGDEELERAKKYFAGSTRIGLQTNSAHARDLSRNWFMSLPLDHTTRVIEEVQGFTLEQMRECAATYFTGDQFAGAIMRGKS